MIIFGIILTAIGGLLLIAFASSILRCRTGVEATISRFIEKKLPVRGGTRTEYTPVFSYRFGGREYTANADTPVRNPKNYFVGQKVTLLIDKNHPEKTRFGSNLTFFFTGLVIGALGVITIAVALM